MKEEGGKGGIDVSDVCEDGEESEVVRRYRTGKVDVEEVGDTIRTWMRREGQEGVRECVRWDLRGTTCTGWCGTRGKEEGRKRQRRGVGAS